MEYCFSKGFLVALLVQHCTSEVVTLQDGQTSSPRAELPSAEVVPVLAPPSLQEVQQAVQEASEQAEGRGAEEVLKQLLERVVEAAMGQVEGGGEAKADEAAEMETLVADKGETDSGTEEVQEKAQGEDMGDNGSDTNDEEDQAAKNVNSYEDVAEAEKGVVEGKVETAAGPVEKTTANGANGGIEAEKVEDINESLDTEVIHEVIEETVAALEATGGHASVEEEGVDDNKKQAELSGGKLIVETNTQEGEEAQADVEAVGSESELETGVDSDDSLTLEEMEGQMIVALSANSEMETTTTVLGVLAELEEEVNIIKHADVEDQSHLVVEGGDAKEVELDDIVETEGGETYGESVIKENSEALVNERLGDQQAGEEQITLENSHDKEDDQEVLVISDPEPEDGADAPIEQSPENQTHTTSPSLGGMEGEGNTLGEKFSDGNEIITPTDDLLPHDPVVAQPTLDNSVTDVLHEHPRAIEEVPVEANELVEGTAGSTETSEQGPGAWKIGAITAAVFLVLETVAMIIYIFKCRDKKSTLAVQRACEEGCVEPEAATGGDCSDDVLLAGNGNTQQKTALDLSTSTLAKNKEQHEEEHGTVMSDLSPHSTEELANTGLGPDSSHDLRTSIL